MPDYKNLRSYITECPRETCVPAAMFADLHRHTEHTVAGFELERKLRASLGGAYCGIRLFRLDGPGDITRLSYIISFQTEIILLNGYAGENQDYLQEKLRKKNKALLRSQRFLIESFPQEANLDNLTTRLFLGTPFNIKELQEFSDEAPQPNP
jgi:hypothetical protein